MGAGTGTETVDAPINNVSAPLSKRKNRMIQGNEKNLKLKAEPPLKTKESMDDASNKRKNTME